MFSKIPEILKATKALVDSFGGHSKDLSEE